MTLTRKVLAVGQLAATTGTIYDPTSGKWGLVHNICIHNTNTTNETVQIFYHNGTTSYRMFNLVVTPGDTAVLDFNHEGFIVDAAGYIQGVTTTAAKVNYKIDGTEES